MKRKSRCRVPIVISLLVLLNAVVGHVVFATPSSDNRGPQIADYHYDPILKPDPFRPFVETELVLKKKADKTTGASIFPLQKISLDQFNLVGIAGDAKRKIAIVETKDKKGKFYPLVLGTIIGLNSGKVVEIKNDLIVVAEVERGRTGRKLNKIMIKLHRDGEEGTP